MITFSAAPTTSITALSECHRCSETDIEQPDAPMAADLTGVSTQDARLARTLRLAKAYQLYFSPTCYAVSPDDRIVPCLPCKKVYRVHYSNYAAAVSYHAHTSSDGTPPASAIINTANRTWLQVAYNTTARAYQYTCGSCAKIMTYEKRVESAALAFHLGEYCVRPDPVFPAPEPLTEEILQNSKTASAMAKEQEYIRTTLATTINGSDALANINAHNATPATPVIITTPPATNRPHDDGEDAPQQTKRTPPPRAGSPQLPASMESRSITPEDGMDQSKHIASTNVQQVSAPPDDPTDRILVGKPPPIIIDDTWDSDYFDRYERYNTGLTHSLECKLAGRGDSLILRCKNYTDYNVLLSNLRRNNEPFTTQTPKHEKSTRLVATRLPIGISSDRVMSELQAKNTKISAAYRITAPDREKGGTKSLTAVVCTFPPGTPLHAVSSAAPTIAGCAVRWHPFDTKGEPVQCFRCQDFNHTSCNCNRLEQCRRCSRHHASKNCDTPTEVRCANCGESHPTNYRGCGYYKHIKQTNVSKRAATIKPPHPSPPLPCLLYTSPSPRD